MKYTPFLSNIKTNTELSYSNFFSDICCTYFPIEFLNLFDSDNNKQFISCLREYLNLDLVLKYSKNNQENYIVIENKIKAFPTLEQLTEYSNKLVKKSIIFSCFLLAPKRVISQFKTKYSCSSSSISIQTSNGKNVIWKFITHEHLANSINVPGNVDSYIKSYIDDYKETTLNLLNSINEIEFPNIVNDTFYIKNKKEVYEKFSELKFDDTIKKIWINQVSNVILENSNVLPKGICEFSRKEASLTYRVEISPDIISGIQIQGNAFKTFIRFDKRYKYKKSDKEVDPKLIEILNNALCGLPKEKIKNTNTNFENCLSYVSDVVFIYTYSRLKEDIKIKELIQYIENSFKYFSDINIKKNIILNLKV